MPSSSVFEKNNHIPEIRIEIMVIVRICFLLIALCALDVRPIRHVYTTEEYAQMVEIYIRCNYIGTRAAEMYRQRFPQRHHPDHRVFINAYARFLQGDLRVNPQRDQGVRPENLLLEDEVEELVAVVSFKQREKTEKSKFLFIFQIDS